MNNKQLGKIKSLILLTYSILKRKLAFDFIPVFITDRCNSRCKICNIWRKYPKSDLDPKIFKSLLDDKTVSRFSCFIIGGGEPILHPKFEEIIKLVNDYGNYYVLLSNGLLADKLISIVRKFRVKHISLSLDGTPTTYRYIRGVDGYSKVEKVVKELKNSDVKINIGYTVSPWNTKEDLIHVINFCRKYEVSLTVGYYGNVEYYDVRKTSINLYRIDDLVDHPYHQLYPLWSSGGFKMPCLSIFLKPVIRPNGDVELCEHKQIKLGNLHKQNMEDIWRSKKTCELQKQYIGCNACWHDSQRLCDISIISILKPITPLSVLNGILGEFDWKKILESLD